jgi:hypothetical protein
MLQFRENNLRKEKSTLHFQYNFIKRLKLNLRSNKWIIKMFDLYHLTVQSISILPSFLEFFSLLIFNGFPFMHMETFPSFGIVAFVGDQTLHDITFPFLQLIGAILRVGTQNCSGSLLHCICISAGLGAR